MGRDYMENNFYYHYCYRCDKETVFSNVRKDGKKVKDHCTICGTFKWFNDGELKERYFKNIMGGVSR